MTTGDNLTVRYAAFTHSGKRYRQNQDALLFVHSVFTPRPSTRDPGFPHVSQVFAETSSASLISEVITSVRLFKWKRKVPTFSLTWASYLIAAKSAILVGFYQKNP